jgi:hypothetical protein
VLNLRKLGYIAHVALGFSGAAFFVALSLFLWFLFPRIDALLAHADQAAHNVTQASGVWANSAAAEAGQVNSIARDTRASIVATGRLADKLTELTGTAQKQMALTGPLLDSLTRSSDAIAPAVTKIGNTAGAAADLLTSTTKTMNQLNDPASGISPLMATYIRSGQDLNKILEQKAITRMLDSFAGIANNGELMSSQLEDVTKKAHDDYLGPHPWYTKIGRFASDGFDYGAAFARHMK